MNDDSGNTIMPLVLEDKLAAFLQKVALAEPDKERVCFFCIGSDRSTGDSFGPLVGTLLKINGWPRVIGTLERPCDAHAVEAACREAAAFRAEGQGIVVAIDACLGKPLSAGSFLTAEGPIQPGAATGAKLPPVGDYSIAGVVNVNGPKPYALLQTTPLFNVLQMAGRLADAIGQAWDSRGLLEEAGSGREQDAFANDSLVSILAMGRNNNG